MKSAYALLRKGTVFIQSYSKATTGLWIATGPVYVAEEHRVDELGSMIQEALNDSTEGVPHPGQAEWKSIQRPMLEAAGVKSWTTLAKGAKSVGIECRDSVVTMVPSSDYQNKGGAPLLEKAVIRWDSRELGSALIAAFDACD